MKRAVLRFHKRVGLVVAALALVGSLGVPVLAQTGPVGTMTSVNQKRADYDDAYTNWEKQDVSPAALIGIPTAEAVDKIHKAAQARDRVQKTRQDYLTTLQASYQDSADKIAAAPVAKINVTAIKDEYDKQVDGLNKELATIEAELKSIEKDTSAAATIYRGHLNQRHDSLEKLVLDLSRDKSAVGSAEGSPEKIDASRKLLKQDLGKLAEAIGASSKTVDAAGAAWKTYYASLEDEITNQKSLAEQKRIADEKKAMDDAAARKKADDDAMARRAQDNQLAAQRAIDRQTQVKDNGTSRMQSLVGQWGYDNPLADVPRKEDGEYKVAERYVDLHLNPDGTGSLKYVVESGKVNMDPSIEFEFGPLTWNGDSLAGNWNAQGASGTISVTQEGDKLILDWHKDPGKKGLLRGRIELLHGHIELTKRT